MGWVLTGIGLIMAWNQWRLNDVLTTQAETTKRLDDRISKEALRTDKELTEKSIEINTIITGVANRIGDDVKSIRESVIFKDVFEQHEKFEKARYQGVERIFRILEEQMKSASSSNTEEHNRICGKVDSMVHIFKEEIDRAVKAKQ